MQRLVTSADAHAVRLTQVLPGRAFWISGTGRHEHRIEEATTEPLLLKGGAEGVFMGALPKHGIGFALKARDGADRAARAAVTEVLVELDVLKPGQVVTNVTNAAGTVVGTTEAYLP